MSPTLTNGKLSTMNGDNVPVPHDFESHKTPSAFQRSVIQTNFETSYPSQSLGFLRRLRLEQCRESGTAPQTPAQAQLKLDIIIVGAGLGGLATAVALARRGHSVTVLEQAEKLGEASKVGAGIQIPPNSGVLLRRWGVMEHMREQVVQPADIKFRRWEDGSVIGCTRLDGEFNELYEEPYHVVHRAHFHDALYQTALDNGVTVKLDSKVRDYDMDKASVVLENGLDLKADLVVAADGIKSSARPQIVSHGNTEPRTTGFAAYRATVDVKKMEADPEISWILETPGLNVWIGEERHVMTYTIAAGKSFNLVLSHIDHTDPSTWRSETAVSDMQKEFAGWDRQLTKIISLIDHCLKWPLKTCPQLNTWTAASSRVVMLGDAAHAMLPYMSEGAAMAVEDGAALAVALNEIRSTRELGFALRAFETERIQRAGAMVEASAVNGVLWHFADGPEQRARDAAMRAEVDGRPFLASANQWSDPVTQHWAYGYDAERAMEVALQKAVNETIASV